MIKLGINVELLPVPRRLSSDCGIGARFSTGRDISGLISEDIDKLYAVEKDGERLYTVPKCMKGINMRRTLQWMNKCTLKRFFNSCLTLNLPVYVVEYLP